MVLDLKDCNFQSRLAFVLAGRSKYPWARIIGIPSGTVDRMFKGYVPGHRLLRLIMYTENVSIAWLTEGVGAPYLVRWHPTDEECRLDLEEILDFQDWGAVHLLSDGGRLAVVVVQGEGRVKYKEEDENWIPYTEIVVLAGAGRSTVDTVHRIPHRETLASTETVADVAAGRRAGTWYLLGEEGLLTTYQAHDPPKWPRVAEDVRPVPAGTFILADNEEAADAISAEERKVVETYRQLTPDNRVRWREVGDAFIAAGHRKKETGNDE